MCLSCVCYILHDDASYLAASLQSFAEAGKVFAFVSRVPWHDVPGDWQAAAQIAADAGAEVVLGEWRSEREHRQFACGGMQNVWLVAPHSPALRNLTTLSYDGAQFTEYFNDGMQLRYQALSAGGNVTMHALAQVVDANGNAQTYTYGSGVEAGLLKSTQCFSTSPLPDANVRRSQPPNNHAGQRRHNHLRLLGPERTRRTDTSGRVRTLDGL